MEQFPDKDRLPLLANLKQTAKKESNLLELREIKAYREEQDRKAQALYE
jgi:hypothetical protein